MIIRTAEEFAQKQEKERKARDKEKALIEKMKAVKEEILGFGDNDDVPSKARSASHDYMGYLDVVSQRRYHNDNLVFSITACIVCLFMAIFIFLLASRHSGVSLIISGVSIAIAFLAMWLDLGRKEKCISCGGTLKRLLFKEAEVAINVFGSEILGWEKIKDKVTYPLWCDECGKKHIVTY